MASAESGASITGPAGAGRDYGVAIVAPYPSVRAGLRAMLEQISGVTVVAESAGDELDPLHEPDAIIIDVDAEQPAIVEQLGELFPGVPHLLLLDDPEDFDRVSNHSRLRLAALLKSAEAAQIGAALLGLAHGLVVIDPSIGMRMTHGSQRQAIEPVVDSLTPREREVLELLALGLPNKTIAMELGISEHTAKFHVGTIMSKLGAASRTEAVALAARRGLLVL